MSGVPKRSHEEGVPHSSSSSKFPHEDSGSYPKLTPPPPPPLAPPAAQVHLQHHHHQTHLQPPQPHPLPHPHTLSHSHPHGPYELDSRPAKVQRAESRDTERRSPLHSVYKVLPSSISNDTHMTHVPVLEPKENKDGREIRVENRENRSEAREVYGEAKRDHHSGKGERDVKFESRAGDNGGNNNGSCYGRDTKFDKENCNDQKAEFKMEKEGHGHLAWKDQKDYHRGKRFGEGSGGNIDPWIASRGTLQGPSEIGGKEFSGPEEGACLEGHETVGENKVDAKIDDRFKDKEKKRKELKHREWGERDKERNDGRGSLQIGGVTGETKEIGREDREADRWEREKMEQKDRDRLKEREKDHIKREAWSNAEREGTQNDKELGEASVKLPEQENMTSEQKKPKDADNWKGGAERESKDKRRERDSVEEGERAEKRSRINEKESEEGLVDGEGATEKDKDVLNNGVQQRKRMLRPRGSPQMTNRDRFRSRAQDNEGSLGKSEVPTVTYKVGECMQELIKLWKEYESSHPDKSGDFANNGPILEVRIPADHVTATNRQVRGGQLWGTDIYTDDSDLVAVLMHTGYCRPTASPPPPAIQELRATIRVLPSQDCYTSKLRNNVRSRAWGAGIGCSYRVERCYVVKKEGGTIELEPCLTHSSTVEPTLAPMAVERSMTTRAAASNALRQQRFVREVTIQYNLCNEPWIKYSISMVADKGLKKPLFTSARLKKGEVLYLETHSCRYELCFAGEKSMKAVQASHSSHEAETDKNHHAHMPNGEKTDSDNVLVDVFRWSRCKKPLPQKVMRSIGVPLPPDHIQVIEESLDWEDVQWSQTGVWIGGKEYTLARLHFLSPN
ncbi:PREDICTED: zinc finger CCCH domain-containing protein 13 [Tarenaya hassleriana]|uniref:zinc finger CCCH domain-containing protein 13 n=1 Tax=Tarenaya hassleriana TaxID=28532 RepID=UPI00053C9E58|nr:PREDICTED: zinc finger CCCH domain-containing protein 13 [Tarenaya hassleriana]XP_019056837.1 PREDICTED: zinc finger CCCH domain-containing protein 13 [Tarenaya hassleriana]